MTRGLLPPDPRSLCPLSSTEFLEPPPRTKFLGTPLKFSNFFFSSANRAVYEIILKKKLIDPDRCHCDPAHALCMLDNSRSEYVILVAFPWQLWSCERASTLRYTYTGCPAYTWTNKLRSRSLRSAANCSDAVRHKVDCWVSMSSVNSVRWRAHFGDHCTFVSKVWPSLSVSLNSVLIDGVCYITVLSTTSVTECPGGRRLPSW
jgi:hypothetical protein